MFFLLLWVILQCFFTVNLKFDFWSIKRLAHCGSRVKLGIYEQTVKSEQ